MTTSARRTRKLLLAALGAVMLAGLGGCSIHAGCRGLSWGVDWASLCGGHGHGWGHHGWGGHGCR